MLRATKGIAARVGLAAFCLAGALSVMPPLLQAESIPPDLDLDRAPVFEILDESGPNPHDSFPCGRCHEKSDVTYETARRYGIEIPLTTEGDSSTLLCEECHGEQHHSFHPVSFRVEEKADEIEKTGIFPLETIVEGFDKITCISCHDVHFPHTRNRLLRGFAVSTGRTDGAFASRLDFCRGCHGEEVREISSHWETAADRTCDLCHLGLREPGRPGGLKRRLNESCVVCHPLPRGRRPHFYSYNPFPDFGRDELEGYGLILEEGRFTCNTCHTHHRPEGAGEFLRPAFVNIVSKSLRVDPHRTTRFCRNCHPITPPPVGTTGANAPLWEEDATRLCRGCHSKEGALKMFHPLAASPPEGMVPEGWARRKDGSLGCQTCHLAGHGPPDPDNVKMLKGGGYEQRNDICFQCHDPGAYAGRNIHAEIVGFKGCEFCHAVKGRTALRPEGRVGDLLAEPTLLCLLCHDPPPHPAGFSHTVKPEDRSFVSLNEEATPLSLGKITCHTCHDSHSPWIEEKFLRTAGMSAPVCHNCHPF